KPSLVCLTNIVLTEQVARGFVVPGSGRLVPVRVWAMGVDDHVIVDMPDMLSVATVLAKDAGWRRLL
ncbi:hypothetical protein BJY52DRAFT_1120624, partial [Lactarius psammicola]